QLAAGERLLADGREFVFRTAPPEQSQTPFRFLAWGDSGTGTLPQFDVFAVIEQAAPAPELVLGLGDLVYENGEPENYAPRFFTPYAPLLRRTDLWTALGNHETHTDDGAPYFEAFYLPTQSGAPGHPSNTEHYYSFDHGMAHFVCIDSENQ